MASKVTPSHSGNAFARLGRRLFTVLGIAARIEILLINLFVVPTVYLRFSRAR